MTVMREYAVAEYWADHGILVVRDQGDTLERDDAGLLEEGAVDAQPGGSIATAGAGWLWARTSGDGDHRVRLALHDGRPADDLADWDDVAETPYRSVTGTVGMSLLTGGSLDGDVLLLGRPGLYRVRVSCRRQRNDGEGDTWRLQFWPAPGGAESPRWLARGTPAADDEPPAWEQVLDYEVCSVLWGAQIAAEKRPAGVSAAQVAAARSGSQVNKEPGPGQPLWPDVPPRPLTTGHPDLDADEAHVYAGLLADQAEREHRLSEIAAQLEVRAPVTVAEVLPLLVKAGLLTVHEQAGEQRYRVAARPPPVQDVLTLPARQLADLQSGEAFHRYAALAADLAAIAWWTADASVGTVTDLAERLLTPPAQVRGALGFAEQQLMLSIKGDPAEEAVPLGLTALRRREDEPAGPRVFTPTVVISGIDAETTRPPDGPPPQAGIVTSGGELVAWRDGQAGVLAVVPGEAMRAVETAWGIAVIGLDQSVLVRPDGQTEVLARNTDHRSATSADGRYLVLAELRRWPKFRLHAIDLANGARQTLDWTGQPILVGMHGGAVFFTAEDTGGIRWTPGADPEPLPWTPRAVDRLTGTILAEGGADGWLVVSPDGELRTVGVTVTADLAPGGTHLFDFRSEPPAVTLFDVTTGATAPRIWWLPRGCETSTSGQGFPVWEGTAHLLFWRRWDPDQPAIRLNVRNGEIERVPFNAASGDIFDLRVFVEPMLRGPLSRPGPGRPCPTGSRSENSN